MKVYVHHNCSSCKKALKWLAEKGLKVEVIDLLKETPTKEEFKTMAESYDGNLKKLFNTSGQLYREQGLKDKISGLSEEEVFLTLSKEGMLVKRPFLITEEKGLVGFKEDAWLEFILLTNQS